MNSYSDEEKIKHEDICEISVVNPKKVAKVKRSLHDDLHISSLADLFKTLADPTRVKILNALSLSELCVCDLAAILGLSQSATSHQLRILRLSRLVKNRKSGKMVYYSLDDEHVQSLMDEGMRHIREDRS